MNPANFPGVRLVGNGDVPVILVHGWMAGSELFEPMLEFMDRQRFTYALLDCRGYGARLEEGGPFDVFQIARDVLALADARQWSRFHVLGHSMAGMAVQWLMSQHPQRLASGILLASVPASGAAITDERRTLLEQALQHAEARLTLIDANVGHTRPQAWLEQMLALSLRTTWPDVMSDYMASWTGDDFAAQMPGCKVPALVLVGEYDPGATRVSMQRTVMTWLPHAHLVELRATGHYPMQEVPSALVEAIESFVIRNL